MIRATLLPILFLSLLGHAAMAQQENQPVEVKVDGLQATPDGISLTLRATDSAEDADQLHIMVGMTEGLAIVRAMRHEKPSRPLTHDLLKAVLDRNGWRVQKVSIRSLTGGTYLADMTLERNGETQVYDVRPSDGIALCLSYDAKLYVIKRVFDEEKQQESQGDEQQQEEKKSEPDTLKL